MPRVLKPADKSSQKKAAEVFIDFQYKAFALTFDALAKALAFYFLLLGASFGIVFQAKPSGQVLTAVLVFAVLLTVITAFAFAVGVKGLLGSIRRLGFSMSTLDSKAFLAQRLDEYFARTRKFVLLVAVLCEVILVLIASFSSVVLVLAHTGVQSSKATDLTQSGSQAQPVPGAATAVAPVPAPSSPASRSRP